MKITNGILGIIPARGGSKGVPKKNIRLLGSKPLIAYSIEAALQSRIDRVMVSTDDLRIARAAKRFGADVPFLRPSSLATDTASSLSVLLHALHHMETVEKYPVAAVVFIQPTSPFLQPYHIDRGLEILEETRVDSVAGIEEVSEHPYFQFQRNGRNILSALVSMNDRPLRRQDLPVYFTLNSALYISRRRYFHGLKDPSPVFNPDSLAGIAMERHHSIDIDTPLDFLIAEAILKSGFLETADRETENRLWNVS